jgi:hypothetical protein
VNNYKHHIAYRITTLFVVACLVLPTVVKFSHVLSHHEHEVCLGENQSHFHEIDMDCEFFKFKLSNSYYFLIETFSINENFVSNKVQTKYHTYLKSHQQLSTYLRGPPCLT